MILSFLIKSSVWIELCMNKALLMLRRPVCVLTFIFFRAVPTIVLTGSLFERFSVDWLEIAVVLLGLVIERSLGDDVLLFSWKVEFRRSRVLLFQLLDFSADSGQFIFCVDFGWHCYLSDKFAIIFNVQLMLFALLVLANFPMTW